jgi:two-component system, sensor histidine kinase and response regulator
MSCELDLSQALARLDGDSQLLAELGRLFQEETPKLLANLGTAVTERDAQGIETYAHSLKGTVSYFNPAHAQDYAFALEQKGRENDMGGVDELFRQLQEALEGCMRELESLR